jgi:hypothetical protein
VTFINETGEEVVAQAKLTPLIGADPVGLESMMPAARDLAKIRTDADILREIIGFAAERLTDLGIGSWIWRLVNGVELGR